MSTQSTEFIQSLQEDEYSFPYHYLVDFSDSAFSLHKHLYWGYEYASYIEYVEKYVTRGNSVSILDVGCGDGKFLSRLSNQKERHLNLNGIDYSHKAISFAQAFNYGNTISFRCNSVTDLTTDKETYDLVTLIEVIEHIPPDELPKFIENCLQLLKSDGKLLITTPTTNIATNRKHFQHFNYEKIENLLDKNIATIEQTNYLNKKSFLVKIIQRIYSNRIFILNSSFLNHYLYKIYKKFFLIADSRNGTRIFILIKKY